MLSFKVTYALQVLDLLQHSPNGMTLGELKDQFLLLPSGTIISDTVKQLESGRLICNISPKGKRYRVMSSLNDISLYDLVHLMDGKILLGKQIGFDYWPANYLKTHPQIAEVERQLEESVAGITKMVTVGKLINTTSVFINTRVKT